MIKAIVFDVGGTLIGTNKKLRQKLFERVFKKYKLDVKDYDKFWLLVLEVSVDANVGKIKSSKSFWEYVLGAKLNENVVKELDNCFLSPRKLYNDVKNVLRKLERKYELAVVSNANVFWFYPIFNKFKLKKFFDVVIVSAEVRVKKPDKRIFEIALKKLKVKPQEAVYVGNEPRVDIDGAKGAGMKTVLVVRKKEVLEEVEAFGVKPDFVVDNLYQLENVLSDIDKK